MKYLYLRSTLIMLAFGLYGCGNEASKAEPNNGELVFQETCRACHAQGINGAPIYGNKEMWSKRLSQGVPTLIEHATHGFGLMPAKGGDTELSDQDISDAVIFMIAAAQE